MGQDLVGEAVPLAQEHGQAEVLQVLCSKEHATCLKGNGKVSTRLNVKK